MSEAKTIQDLQPNATLGHYTILQHIADGGMGHVFRAFEPALQREVAIKVLKPELAQSLQQITSFEEEAQNIAALRHPNIVPIHYIGRQGELCYFAMSFIEGGATLDNWIEASTPIGLDQALWVLRQAVEALDWAFQRGMIHLDIKPSNFLVDSTGAILLADFGLARSVTSLSQGAGQAECYGTPAYMSPEQILNQKTDQRSDIYSLGATLYHLITMNFLFDGDTLEEILSGHLHKPFPLAQAQASALTPGWINLLDRMTQKKPEDRFQTYDELRRSLANIDKIAPTQARRTQQVDPNILPVPNRSSEPKETLYGLLKKEFEHWGQSGVDTSCRVTQERVMEALEKPKAEIQLTALTEAFLELQIPSNTPMSELVEAFELMDEMKCFLKAIAQSSIYNATQEAPSTEKAIEIVGIPLASQLILTAIILRTHVTKTQEFNWWALWQHSLAVAVATVWFLEEIEDRNSPKSLSLNPSHLLQNVTKGKTRRLAFLAGLIHDIGKLFLGEKFAYPYFMAMHAGMKKQKSLVEAEKEMFVLDHQKVGELWCARFSFEGAVRDAVALHHGFHHRFTQLGTAVFFADYHVKRQGIGFSGNPVIEFKDLSTSAAWQNLVKNNSLKLSFEEFDERFARYVAQIPAIKPFKVPSAN